MRTSRLILSHWNASIPIYVPPKIVQDLESHHIKAVRFLYDCFQRGQGGAILNHQPDLTYEIQIIAFLNALENFITPKTPILIVSSSNLLIRWKTRLRLYTHFSLIVLNETNCTGIAEDNIHKVILSSIDDTKLLREIKVLNFFSVIVSELDSVVTKNVIKQLKSKFQIGLTNRNFLKHRDQKLLWSMLCWCKYENAGKLEDFCMKDTEHLENLRDPYRFWWQRLTRNYCDDSEPSLNEEGFQEADEDKNKTLPPERGRKGRKTKVSNAKTVQDGSGEFNEISGVEVENKISKRNTRKIATKSQDKLPNTKSNRKFPLKILESSSDTDVEDVSENKKFKLETQNSSIGTTITDDENNWAQVKTENFQTFNSSQETIIYDEDQENPILASIISGTLDQGNAPNKPRELVGFEEHSVVFNESPQIHKKEDSDDDILSSIIRNN